MSLNAITGRFHDEIGDHKEYDATYSKDYGQKDEVASRSIEELLICIVRTPSMILSVFSESISNANT
jgi:hypothetical protein